MAHVVQVVHVAHLAMISMVSGPQKTHIQTPHQCAICGGRFGEKGSERSDKNWKKVYFQIGREIRGKRYFQ